MIIDLDYKQIVLDEENGISVEMKAVDAKSYSLLVKQMRSIFNIQNSVDITSELGQIEMGMAQLESPELIEISKGILPKFCKNLKGIQLKENNSLREATIDDLTTSGSGMTLCIRIITELFTLSSTTNMEADKVKKQ